MLSDAEFERLKKFAVRIKRLEMMYADSAHACRTEITHTVDKYNELSADQTKQIWDLLNQVEQE